MNEQKPDPGMALVGCLLIATVSCVAAVTIILIVLAAR